MPLPRPAEKKKTVQMSLVARVETTFGIYNLCRIEENIFRLLGSDETNLQISCALVSQHISPGALIYIITMCEDHDHVLNNLFTEEHLYVINGICIFTSKPSRS